jgi:hypothetical protein
MMSGTVRHPRVRDLTERFESTVLPLFRRWTQEVGTLLPELYGHELSTGDFGRRHAACEARAIQRLTAQLKLDYEAWKQ